ncbi:unnamed protein product [Sphenostylis stenocarpa]|uniref:BSD domain-containing protein n=1 Tax=Sphenostylis stenocarpa TaxID=92480 RepID=A0AA86S9R2_9FABA|nr:unnamed protein product [Sphenostylis stenocarpa]
MELWNRARSFAEEASKRSHDLSLGASKLSDIITETTKEIAVQASKHLPQPSLVNDVDLHRFGITEELREFVKGITITTFEDFPIQDDSELSDVPAVSNVRQDLTDWQEKHASLVLSTVKDLCFCLFVIELQSKAFALIQVVMIQMDIGEIEGGARIEQCNPLMITGDMCIMVNKKMLGILISNFVGANHWVKDIAFFSLLQEISRLRYELCPRVMKERKFWRIYFILVNNHTAPYEKQYMEDEILKSSEHVNDHKVTMEPLNPELICKQEAQKEAKLANSSTEKDLDAFLLGEGNSDDEPDDGDGKYDDDLDKLMDNSITKTNVKQYAANKGVRVYKLYRNRSCG